MLATLSMASSIDPDPKESKRQARLLLEQAEAAFAVGDYLTARQLYDQISEVASGTDAGIHARAQRTLMKMDPATLYSGLFGLFMFGIAILVSLL